MKRNSTLATMAILMLIATILTWGCSSPAPTAAPAKEAPPAATPVPKATTYEWKMPMNLTAGSWDADQGVAGFAKKIESASAGRIKITVFPGPAFIPGTEMFNSLKQGAISIAQSSDAYVAGQMPIANVAYGLPGGGRQVLDGSNFFINYKFRDMLNEYYHKQGVHAVGDYFLGGVALLSKVPIKTAADFKGVKIRSAGLLANMFTELGASTVTVPAPELYTALATGVVQAAHYGGVKSMWDLKLHEVTGYLILPKFQPWDTSAIWMNYDVWNGLPNDLKEIVDLAMNDLTLRAHLYYYGAEQQYTKEMQKKGVQVITLSDADWKTVQAASTKVWGTYSASDPGASKAVDLLKTQMRDLGYIE